MYRQQEQTAHQYAPAAHVDQPHRAVVSVVQMSRADLLANQHRRGVGKSREEADDKALKRAEYRGCGDGLLRLPPQNHVDNHHADADEQLIADYREALAQVFL